MFTREKLKRLLNPAQFQAATHKRGPLLILAGAGSGKTRVITHRTAYLLSEGVSPKKILCVTFTNKAASEMKDRVEQLVGKEASKGLRISTFHAFCLNILKRNSKYIGYANKFNIYNSSDQKQALYEVCRDLGVDIDELPEENIRNAISNAKNELILADDMPESTQEEKAIKIIFKRYQEYLLHIGAMDFDDLIYKTYFLLKENPQVLHRLQNYFQYLMIDEYQDTNKAQYEIAKLLVAAHRNLAVVGDDDQSIYAWRGADLRNILHFEDDFPGTVVVRLQENYRSTSTILKAANAVIKNNTERKLKELYSELGRGENIETFENEDPWREAEKIADDLQLKNLRENIPYRQFAILYRTHTQTKAIEDVFRIRRIPYQLTSKLDFYDRKEIKDAMAYVKVLNNPDDDLNLLRIINYPKRGIGQGTIKIFKEYAFQKGISCFQSISELINNAKFPAESEKHLKHFHSLIGSYSPMMQSSGFANYLNEFFHHIDFRAEIEKEKSDDNIKIQKVANVDQLMENIAQYDRKRKDKAKLSDFLLRLMLFMTNEMEEEEELANNAVKLMTIHASKGLEFPHVFIIGFEENIMPYVRDETQAVNLEEERRLCYVAMTRAKETLCLSYCMERKRQGSTLVTKPSRFLDEIPVDLINRSDGANFFKDKDEKKKVSKEEMASLGFEEMNRILGLGGK